MKLLPFYEALLSTFNIEVGEDHGLYLISPDATECPPVCFSVHETLTGKKLPKSQLFLPAKEILKKENSSEYIKFHPLGENMFHANSDILNLIIRLMNTYFSTRILETTAALLKVAANKDAAELVSMDGLDLISGLSVSKTGLQTFMSLYKKSTGYKGEYPVAKVVLEREKIVGGKKALRSTKVIAPILESYDDEIFDKSLSSKNFQIYMTAFERVIGDLSDYRQTSVLRKAPGFHAMLKFWAYFCERINGIHESLGEAGNPDCIVDLSWVKSIDALDKLYRECSNAYTGNIGLDPNKKGAGIREEATPKVAVKSKPETKPVVTKSKTVAAVTQRAVEDEPVNNMFKGHKLPVIGAGAPAREEVVDVEEVEEVEEVEVRRQPQTRSAPVVKRAQQQPTEYHLRDAYGEYLFLANGEPFFVEGMEFIDAVQEFNQRGQPIFNNDGTPVLVEEIPQQQGGYPQQRGGYQQGGDMSDTINAAANAYGMQQQGGYPQQRGGYPQNSYNNRRQGGGRGYPQQQRGGYNNRRQGGGYPQRGGYPQGGPIGRY